MVRLVKLIEAKRAVLAFLLKLFRHTPNIPRHSSVFFYASELNAAEFYFLLYKDDLSIPSSFAK